MAYLTTSVRAAVQNAAARRVFGARGREHITSLANWPHWLRVREIIEFKHSLLAFKTINQVAQDYLQEYLVPTASRKLQLSPRSDAHTSLQNITWFQVIFSRATDMERSTDICEIIKFSVIL